MADTCIVCLGDLATEQDATTTSNTDGNASVDTLHTAPSEDIRSRLRTASKSDDRELIAHLLPCGHNLHDDCLKPWVERANSCPICRTNFNMVELSETIGGPVLSSYAVKDKQQQAEIDPSMFIDDDLFDEESDEPCLVCEEYGGENEILVCDGCDGWNHASCAHLSGVPLDIWLCDTCKQEQTDYLNGRRTVPAPRPRRTARTRAPVTRDNEWTSIWRSVYSRIGLDLDHPYANEEPEEQTDPTHRRDFQQWQRRFQVATRQGAGSRFRNTIRLLNNPRAAPQPEPQAVPVRDNMDDRRAWDAFDRQRQSEEDTRPNPRKRKSPTASPAEPAPEPERKLKRPMLRRPQDLGERSTQHAPEAQVAGPSSAPLVAPLPSQAERGGPAPSFLQSLLKEVETTTTPNESGAQPSTVSALYSTADRSSPRPSSPELSPVQSRHPSPHGRSPSPRLPNGRSASPTRPQSPPPLSSIISPIFPRVVDFHPYSPGEASMSEDERGRLRARQRKVRKKAEDGQPASSPTRDGLSYSTKSEIQRMVKAELRPRYQNQELTSDEFTDINRSVSRLLYDRLEKSKGLEDKEERDRLQRLAANEVDVAIGALRGSPAKAPEVSAAATTAVVS